MSTLDSRAISRRTVARGAAWAMPVVVLAAQAPALAASVCGTPTATGGGSLTYDWGTVPADPKTTATTSQSLTFYGAVGAINLPPDAVITSISYEYWIQARNDSTTNPDGSSGSHGPGVYDPGNGASSISGTCKISYSTVTSCAYKGTAAPMSTGGRAVSTVFTSGTSTSGVKAAWTDHAFKLLNGSTVTEKGWQFVFTGDPSIANSLLTTNAAGCKTLADQITPQFNVTYNNVLQAANAERTIHVDRTAYITYTSGGKTYTISKYQPSTVVCDSSGSGGGVNRC